MKNDAEQKRSLQETKNNPAYTIDPSEKGNFQDHGEKVSDEEKEEADRQEDEEERRCGRHPRGKVDQIPQYRTSGLVIGKGRPPSGHQTQERADLADKPLHEPICRKSQQNGP